MATKGGEVVMADNDFFFDGKIPEGWSIFSYDINRKFVLNTTGGYAKIGENGCPIFISKYSFYMWGCLSTAYVISVHREREREMDRDWGSKPGSGGVASAQKEAIDRRERLRLT
ncbi:hypothetical protein IEQ34_012301 [Dendrobium chrysotoxum]|uniref:Uncharacterized protein n=1 Tax=Dendrobium chrysotoxum TaxID=161865 RepID=A0AAV7GTL2_DENCH|nr:hypothetical protein IEQ34_012301 [Dendrobium chrysotoxum]